MRNRSHVKKGCHFSNVSEGRSFLSFQCCRRICSVTQPFSDRTEFQLKRDPWLFVVDVRNPKLPSATRASQLRNSGQRMYALKAVEFFRCENPVKIKPLQVALQRLWTILLVEHKMCSAQTVQIQKSSMPAACFPIPITLQFVFDHGRQEFLKL